MPQPWEPNDDLPPTKDEMIRKAQYILELQESDGSTDAQLEANFVAWMREARYPRRTEAWIQKQARECRELAGRAA